MENHHRVQEWTSRIADLKASGLTMSAWCEAHGQTIHRLKYWLRKLNRSSTSTPSTTTWLPVAIANPPAKSSSSCFSFVVRVGNAGIEVQDGFNPELLRKVVSALELPC